MMCVELLSYHNGAVVFNFLIFDFYICYDLVMH